MANYYINYDPLTVNANETWGDNSVSDNATTPLTMTIHPNEGYYISSSMLTIKGYEPTSTQLNGDRIWEHNVSAIDANGNSVTTNLNDFSKIEMSDTANLNITWPEGTIEELFNNDLPELKNKIDLSSVGFDEIAINNEPMAEGDMIGAFYEVNGQYYCAGFITWGDQVVSPVQMVMGFYIYGQNDDGYGFSEGDYIHLFIRDVSEDKTYSVNYEHSVFSTFWGPGLWPYFTEEPGPFGWGMGGTWYRVLAPDSGELNQDQSYVQVNNWAPPILPNGDSWTNSNWLTMVADTEVETTSLDNYINVKAWLNSDYQIGSNNVELTLDIDGDATPLNTSSSNIEFNIIVKLGDGLNSNCKIISDISFLTSGNTGNPITNTFSNSMFGGGPGWFAEAVDTGDDTIAKIKFTGSCNDCVTSGNTGEIFDTPLTFGSINSLFNGGGGAGSGPDCGAFVIIPNENYTVSKSNFWIETMGDSTTNIYSQSNVPQFAPYPWKLDQTGNVFVNYGTLGFQGEIFTTSNNEWVYYAEKYGSVTEGFFCDAPSCDDEWLGNDLCWTCGTYMDLITNPKVGLQDSSGSIEYFNFIGDGVWTGQVETPYGSNSPIYLIDAMLPFGYEEADYPDYSVSDSIENWQDYNFSEVPYPFEYNSNNPYNVGLNPSDYEGNVILMFIQGLDGYTPIWNLDENGEIKDMVFTIHGSAMENLPQNNAGSVDFNITITDTIG